MKIARKGEIERTEECEVRLSIYESYARLTSEGGLHLAAGTSRMYVLPEHMKDFRELMLSVLMEMER